MRTSQTSRSDAWRVAPARRSFSMPATTSRTVIADRKRESVLSPSHSLKRPSSFGLPSFPGASRLTTFVSSSQPVIGRDRGPETRRARPRIHGARTTTIPRTSADHPGKFVVHRRRGRSCRRASVFGDDCRVAVFRRLDDRESVTLASRSESVFMSIRQCRQAATRAHAASRYFEISSFAAITVPPAFDKIDRSAGSVLS